MKKCIRCLCSLVLVVCLVLSLFSGVIAAPSSTKIYTTPSGYTSASQVNYVTTSEGYRMNWGARGEDCGFLTTYAQSFYTGSYQYSTLSKVSGGTSTSNAPSSSLYSSLQTLMVNNHTFFTKYGSSSSSDCKKIYQYTDCMLSDPTYVSTLYRGLTVGGPWDGGVSYNQEHIWPQSKCLGTTSNSDIGDIMQLRPANPSENSSRQNTAYGESSTYYDPGVSVRGDCARTLLYMYVRWGNTNMWGTDGVIESLDILLDWIKEDPVDTWEMGHNDAVQSITGTRNVFVDYPEYAYLLFGRSIPSDLTTPSNGGDPDAGGGSSGGGTVTGSTATLVTNASTLKAGDQIIIAALDYDYALGTTQNTNNRSAASVTHSGSTVIYGSDVQVLTLETGSISGTFALQAGSGQYLSAASSSGNYLKTRTVIDGNSSWTLGVDATTGAAFITANGTYTRNLMRYNASSDLFSCYSASNTQKDVAIYRIGSSGDSGGSSGGTTGSTAIKVTGSSSLKAGDQIIIAGLDYDYALGTTQNTSNRSQAAVTKSGNALNYGSDVQVLTLVTGSVSGTFALQAGTGKYLYAPSSSSNHLKTTDSIVDNASWYISVDSSTGAASVVAAGTSTRNILRYNASSGLFSCYAAGNTQKDLTIYRIEASGSCGHSYTSRVSTYATCTTTGVRTYTCTLCGDSYTESIPAKGHSYSSVVTAPTCTAQGYTTHTCSTCGNSYIDSYTSVSSHSYSSVVTAPTCTSQGYTTYTCIACGSSYRSSYTNATGHSYTSQVTTAATCTTPGVRTYTCSGCYGSYTETIPAKGHSYSGGRCTACGAVDPNCSHSYTSWVSTAATCTASGLRTYSCTLCGDSYTETIPATGHSYVGGRCSFCGAADPNASVNVDYYLVGYINGADYGCESDWENLGVYQFVDGKLTASFVQDSYIFVKTGDNSKWLLADAYCEATTCTFREGSSEKMFVPGGVELTFTLVENADGSVTVSYTKGSAVVCSHSYTSKVTAEATCTTDGLNTYTCTKCGYTYTQTVPAVGHRFVNSTCTVCGAFDGSTPLNETYYLVGWINGADYGCESDWENMGDYKFVNGQLTAKFSQDSYVFVKTEGNGRWLLADSYCTDTTCTFSEGKTEKMFVPGGVQLFFSIVENEDGSVTVSYTKGGTTTCDHSYTGEVTKEATCTTAGVRTYTCIKCGHSYTQNIAANGHNFFGGSCSVCGAQDPNGTPTTGTSYYLVGHINGADHGCDSDWQNLGNYKFVNSRLTAKFTKDSYVFVKTGDNKDFLLAPSYCEASTCSFAVGNTEKMFVPAGVELTFVLTENTDGSVSVTYTSGNTPASKIPTLSLKSPALEFKDMITINAFYTAANTEDVVEMGMITYTSKVDRWSVRTADHVIPGATFVESSGRYYSASQGIHAKYLADTFYLATYAKLADGSYVYSKLASYSPMTYANSQLKNSTDMKLKQLAVAMLNYGAEAQLYFSHNTGNLANAALNAEHLALPESYRADMVSSVPAASATKQGSFANNSGFSSRKPAISFEGAFCINYFFTPKYAPSNGITLYYWDAADFAANSVLKTTNATGSIKLSGSGTGEYRGDITGIAAKELSEAVYVAAVYTNGGTTWTSGVLGYSIGTYCSSQASKGGDIANLAKATAVYGYHASQYFG